MHPDIAIILNIKKDHLDWHGSFKNYVNSKFKIFDNQKSGDKAILQKKSLIKIFYNKKFKSKLIAAKEKNYLRIKDKITNDYLKLKVNDKNMVFVLELSKIFKISKNSFIKSINSFKGLPHRQEIFFRKRNLTFINDSKATSFESTKFALANRKNIMWIVGGLPKKGDKIQLGNSKKNILQAYIIGKYLNFFKRQLAGKIKLNTFNSLEKAVLQIIRDIKNLNTEKKINVLLSPASASYDQFNNFEERGRKFKKLVKFYGNKYF